MQDDRYEIHVNPGYGRSRFSRRELGDIAISMIVLAVAFTILYRDNVVMACLEYHLGETGKWAGLLAICLALVVFSFLLHEFSHKFVAQRYGMWSEYRMYPMGLVLTLVTSVIGFLFAAPGAVYIDGPMDRERNGRISVAGPVVNILLAAVGIAAVLAVNDSPYFIDDPMFLGIMVFVMLASLNSFLAVFNLLPVPPLDGSKVFAWNKTVWAAMIAVAAVEIVCVYTLFDISYYPFANPFV